MFPPLGIKYSSQLDLPVCINVINYEGEKNNSSTLRQQNKHLEWESRGKGGKSMFVWVHTGEGDKKMETWWHKNVKKRDRMRGVRGCLSLISPLMLLSWADGAFWKHNVDCSRVSQEMPQLQITDQAKHVWRRALRGINSPPFPSQCTDPSHNLHYWEGKYCQLPTNKHLPISREGITFFSCRKENKVFLRSFEKGEWEERIMHHFHPCPPFSTHFSGCSCLLSPFGHWVLPCHSSDSSPQQSNGAEICFVIRYGNSIVRSQMMPRSVSQK